MNTDCYDLLISSKLDTQGLWKAATARERYILRIGPPTLSNVASKPRIANQMGPNSRPSSCILSSPLSLLAKPFLPSRSITRQDEEAASYAART